MDDERLSDLMRVCQEALARDGADRAAYLDEACVGDAVLRQEVEALLAEPVPRAFLDTPPWAQAPPTLHAGQRLGPYEVIGGIGAGGMGEVYKARDTRLGRSVAIKILPSHLAGDPDRRRRFEQEARAVSALNHPHICTLHDIGSEAGCDYLVMEYVDGQTLANRLAKGPLPLAQALEYAIQVAEALAAAHRAGIVHRDLKPANLMLTKSGVKLLDFGVAGLAEAPGGETSRTTTVASTILGTVPYMAPEQVQRLPCDARSDIFAFGAVAYEMVTGKQAFEGETATEVAGAILEREPTTVSALQPAATPALERLVTRCLAKDPDRRWQSIADVAEDLRWIASGPSGAPAAGSGPRLGAARFVHWQMAVALVATLAVGGGAGALLWHVGSSSSRPAARAMRLAITLPADRPLAPAGLVSPGQDRPALALSHDGNRLAYVALSGDQTQICLRDMETGRVTPVGQTAGGHTPFFSPDDEWLGFFAGDKLKKVPLRGGSAVELADAPWPWGATWGTDGKIYFNRFEGEGVQRVDSAGGLVASAVSVGRMPAFVDAGPGLLVTRSGRLHYVGLGQPPTGRLLTEASRAQHLSSGIVIYSAGRTLLASRFDAAGGLTGGPASLAEALRTAPLGVSQFAASDSGTVVWAEGRPQDMTSFVWVDRTGRTEPAGLPEGQYGPFGLSSDGMRLCYELGGELFVWDWVRRVPERLTPRTGDSRDRNQYPLWTPDGQAIFYQSRPAGGDPRLMAALVDRSAPPVELGGSKALLFYPMGFSPDGATLSFFARTAGTSNDLWLMPLDRSHPPAARGEPAPFLVTEFGECFGRISPDGRWMVFSSDSSGAYEVWATTYPNAGPTRKLSQQGGREAVFNPATPGELVYIIGRAMYAVDVSRGVDKAGTPVLLFDGAYPDLGGFGYDMAPDGRFLMLQNPDILRPTTTLQVITNVAELLNRAK
jgi:serine/threonine-protein kinase